MYEAFDVFVTTDTWHTTHLLDQKRFYQALHQVVRLSAFTPDGMAHYIREVTGTAEGENAVHDEAIQRLKREASTIRDFLQAAE
jgi:hypothetical protein